MVYCPQYLKIATKDGRIIPFKLNDPQRKVMSIIEANKDKLQRFIILKARQEGISTLFEGLTFHKTSTKKNRKAVIVGHEKEASSNLFDMCKTFYKHLPDAIRPEILYNNKKELTFSKLNSQIKVLTAEGGKNVGRSGMTHYAHLTEVAFWSNANDAMTALRQMIPDVQDSLVVIESTANGVGGWFYDQWKAAVAGENEYIPIFLAWFELPEYSMEFRSKLERDTLVSSIGPYEQNLIDVHGVTLEQLNWRRYAIRNKCGGDINQFMQEYPSTPEEAFISSGNPVFDINICSRNQAEAKLSRPLVGDLNYTYNTSGRINGVTFNENKNGNVHLVYRPEINPRDINRFVAGCDVAEGLEQGDYSEIRVFDRATKQVCLWWHGHIDADLLAEEQYKIQLFLGNDVWFCTEKNNHGLATILKARDIGVKQYYQEEFGSGASVSTDKLGFLTTVASKPVIIADLNEAIREYEFEDIDPDYWGQCMTFVKNKRGKMGAQGKEKDPSVKCFDDKVMASALMMRCNIWLPPYKHKRESKVTKFTRNTIRTVKKGLADF